MAKGKRARRNVPPKPKPKPKRPPLALFDELGPTARPIVAAAGEHIVLGAGQSLRLHTVDKPLRHVHHAARIVAVAKSSARFAALDHAGVLHLYDNTGANVMARPIGDTPRSLVALPDGRFVALGEAEMIVVDGAGSIVARARVPRPLAAAVRGDSLVIICEERRLFEWTHGTLLDLPPSAEQIVAIAPLADRFVCIGVRHVFSLDLAQRELDAFAPEPHWPIVAASPDGRRLAWAEEASVTVALVDNGKLTRTDTVTYPGTYSTPNGATMELRGLAFLDDDRLAIALDNGRGNIIDLARKQALKLDPQPGDPIARWIFIYNANILVAD